MTLMVKIGNNYIMKESLYDCFRMNDNGCNTVPFNVQNRMVNKGNNYDNNKERNHPLQIRLRNSLQSQSKENNSYNEMLSKITAKRDVLQKILKTYFDNDNNAYSTESKVLDEAKANIIEQSLDEDYLSFQTMISLLLSYQSNNNDNENHLSFTREEYESLTDNQKGQLITLISQYKEQFIFDHLKLLERPYIQPSSSSSSNAFFPSINTTNNSIPINYSKPKNFFDIQTEKYNMFRNYINNPSISDEEIRTHLNICNDDIIKAVDIYFQTKYSLSLLTLRFLYENNTESIHYLTFTTKLIDLIDIIQTERPFSSSFKLFTCDDKEIDILKNKTKFLGTMEFLNNSPIKVKEL